MPYLPWYCSSVTCSIHSTFFPLIVPVMAICVIAVVGEAPCQCLTCGGHQITSPALISSIGPPHACVRPTPAVTIRCCPVGCVCQADLAPGSKVTDAPEKCAESLAGNSGSIRTLPVKNSADPVMEAREPARDIVCDVLLASAASARPATAPAETRRESDKSIA